MPHLSENKIVIVIVLYQTSVESCLTYKTLTEHIQDTSLEYELIIYNNSIKEPIPLSETYHAVNANSNEKLVGAYNYALNVAREQKCKWLLLLDQDTEITKDYFAKLIQFFYSDNDTEEIAAIVPFLIENSKILSPQRINHFAWWQHQLSTSGIQNGRICAFNSLSLLKVEFIDSIGGFSSYFPLDMLDHWYYLQIYNNNKKVFVLDTYIKHQLSLSDYEQNVSLIRHQDLLTAERAFTKKLGLTHYLTYKVRLGIRLFRQMIKFRDKRYAIIILKTLIGKI